MAFVIYNKQVEVFRAPILNRFLKRVTALVKECYPKETSEITNPELDDRLKEDYAVAKSLGVTTQRAVMRFICLGFGLGRKFYEQPDFEQLFSIEWLDKSKFIDLVFDYNKMIVNGKELFMLSERSWWRESLRGTLIKANISFNPTSDELWDTITLIRRISIKVFN